MWHREEGGRPHVRPRPGGPAAQHRFDLALLPSGPDAVRRLNLHRVRTAVRRAGYRKCSTDGSAQRRPGRAAGPVALFLGVSMAPFLGFSPGLLTLVTRQFDLQVELHLVADEHAACLERDVPRQAEILAVDRARRVEPGLLVAPGVLHEALGDDVQ
jgi:hypothetical protein